MQSRYYNPNIGRFINADALVSTGQGLLGNNMFAYCNNNPVILCDSSGTISVTCIGDNHMLTSMMLVGGGGGGGYNFGCVTGGTFSQIDKSIQNTIQSTIDYFTCEDEQLVFQRLKQDGVAFYKGTFVFAAELPFDRSAFSFGIIGMDDYYLGEGKSSFTNTLKHEYGHFVHMQQVGIIGYTITAAIPSLLSAAIADSNESGFRGWMYDNYDSLPWERIANQLGGANRSYAPWSGTIGALYWVYTMVVGFTLR